MVLKIILFALITYFGCNQIQAQTVLFEQNLKADSAKPVFGQNLKHFYCPYFSFGFVCGKSSQNGANVVYGLSNSLNFGVSYKRKISSFYAVGYNLGLTSTRYKINDANVTHFIDDSLQKVKKLVLTDVFFELYNRFNFGKRGNIIGKYIDLGLYGSLMPFSKLNVEDTETIQGKDVVSVKNIRNLSFIEPFGYGVSVKIGINRFAISCSYRIISLFKTSSNLPDLPQYNVGFQIAVY